jgi:hypothetical protein
MWMTAPIEHDAALWRVMSDRLADDTELFKQLSDNPSFKKWLGGTILAAAYRDARSVGRTGKGLRPHRPLVYRELPRCGLVGGAEEDRTPDLRIANATLSQLSYGPGVRGRYFTQGAGCAATSRCPVPESALMPRRSRF